MCHGLNCVVDKLLMIIAEFNNLYMECQRIPQSQAHSHSTAVGLLIELHYVLERSEREILAVNLSRNITILAMFGRAI